jgi:superfamily II DNA or RNA helicase
MSFELRDYQRSAADRVRAAWAGDPLDVLDADAGRRVLLSLPTGGGKTEVAISLAAEEVARGSRCLVVVDRKVLAHQWRSRFEQHGFDNVGLLQGENTVRTWAPVIVATAQTVRSRGVPENVGLIVIDESHVWHETHDSILDKCETAKVLGLSATPLRDGLGKRFDRLIVGATIRELTAKGHLVPAKVFAPKSGAIAEALAEIRIRAGDYEADALAELARGRVLIGDPVSTWLERAEGRQTVAFCCEKQHARDLADAFELEGVTAAPLTDDTPDEERGELFERFNARELRVLTSVGVLSIGFDSPVASCAILARPTLSTMVHLQQAGRVLRPCGGKSDALILDHAGNTLRHGAPIDFEPPTDLSLIDRRSDKKHRDEPSEHVVCRNCEAVYPRREEAPECGTTRKRPSTEVVLDGRLVQYDSMDPPPDEVVQAPTVADVRQFFAEILWHCEQHGWKRGAAFFKTAERFKLPTDYKDPVVKRLLPYSFTSMCQPVAPSSETIRWLQNQRKAHFARQRYSEAVVSLRVV